MKNALRLKLGRHLLPVPELIWRKVAAREARGIERLLASFLTADHHRVRSFVVEALPRSTEPLALETIVEELKLPVERVKEVVDELERRLFFLFRNPQGAISWAYPVTVDNRPHHLAFESGERMTAA